MLDFLYVLFIAPLEYWMHAALVWGYGKTANWGEAVLIMSLVVNFVILPIYMKAEKWQEDERALRKSFEDKEKMIKRTFKGQERFAMISTMQRQAGYSPLLTLRSSIGFFLQVPFFFAAYHFLSHFEPLAGVSFLGLPDLSKPDGLIHWGGFSVNVMPFVMTVINLASALVYTKNLTQKDKNQLYAMAALFLVLLYDAASGLVLYWTCNNVFSLMKNIVLSKFDGLNRWNSVEKEKPYPVALFPLVSVVFLYCPLLILQSDVRSWEVNPTELISKILAFYCAALYICCAIVWFLPRWLLKWIGGVALFLLMVFVAYGTLFTGHYGSLQGTVFSDPASLYDKGANAMRDTVILGGILLLLLFVNKKEIRGGVKFVCLSLFTAIVGSGMWNVYEIQQDPLNDVRITNDEQRKVEQDNEKAIYKTKLSTFSRTGKNIIVFVLDMFTGDHVERLFADYPELKDSFEGFVYYHDTLASGSGTCFGLPAIYGGTDYAYRNLEKRYNKITTDVLASSARKIPESLGSDWNSINAKVEFFYGKTNDEVNFPHNFWYDTFVRESYTKNIEREIEKEEFERLYSYVLFKIVPYSIRKNIYKNGKWILSLQFSLMSVNEYALYRFILDNMTVTESPQNTYKAVHTLLTYTGSICSDKTFEATTDRRSPPVPAGWQASHSYMSYDHYVCEISNMKILSKIFDKMKKLGIYDNTKVIIVSDHGDWDSMDLMQAIGVQPFREDFYGHKVNPGLRSALLMVKDYDQRIPLTIDRESLMSNSDVKHIVLDERFDKSKTRVRYYEAASVVPKKDIGYQLQTLYRVDGSMYRPENWSLVFTRDKK